jgi:hypothetical protein
VIKKGHYSKFYFYLFFLILFNQSEKVGGGNQLLVLQMYFGVPFHIEPIYTIIIYLT